MKLRETRVEFKCLTKEYFTFHHVLPVKTKYFNRCWAAKMRKREREKERIHSELLKLGIFTWKMLLMENGIGFEGKNEAAYLHSCTNLKYFLVRSVVNKITIWWSFSCCILLFLLFINIHGTKMSAHNWGFRFDNANNAMHYFRIYLCTCVPVCINSSFHWHFRSNTKFEE